VFRSSGASFWRKKKSAPWKRKQKKKSRSPSQKEEEEEDEWVDMLFVQFGKVV
jgi:hypothetical protein